MKENGSEINMSNTISTLSQSQASFFVHRPIFLDHPLLEKCFKNNSFAFLYFFLFSFSIDSLSF